MNFLQARFPIMACLAAAAVVVLDGCASSAEKDEVTEDRTSQAQEIKCPAGYTMICEAKKTGRIRFGRLGKDNLDSCACEPEYNSSGRPARTVIPH